MQTCCASLHKLLRGACIRVCATPGTTVTATHRPTHSCVRRVLTAHSCWATNSINGSCSGLLSWHTIQSGCQLHTGSAAAAAAVGHASRIAVAAAAVGRGTATGPPRTAKNKAPRQRQRGKPPDAATRIAQTIGDSTAAAVAAAATGKLPAAGLRKTPPFKQQQQQQQQQQQHAEAGQPAAAAAAAADVSTTQAAGVLAGGQLPLVGREDELFQAALEAMPPKEAQSLVQAATHIARRNQLSAADLSRGLLSVLTLYKEMPHAVDLPTMLTPRVLHMQNSLLLMTARQLRRVLPRTRLTGPLLGQDAHQVSQHIARMAHVLWSELDLPLPTSYLLPLQLSMLLRTSVTNAQHMLFTVRCCMGQDQAARLLQKRPYLLFIPHATVHLAEQAERIAAAYGISKVQAMWLATSHNFLTPTRLMRLEQWQEELQAGMGLNQQQLMQVFLRFPLLTTYPSPQPLLAKLRTLQQLAPDAPQPLLLQLLAHQAVVRHPSAATLRESLVAAAAILNKPVGDLIPWLVKHAGGADTAALPWQPRWQEEASAAAVSQEAAVGEDREELQQGTWWSSASSEDELQQDEHEEEQRQVASAHPPAPLAPEGPPPALASLRAVKSNIWSLLMPAPMLKERVERLCQVFNISQTHLTGMLRTFPTLLAWDPLTISLKLTALSGILVGGGFPTKEAAGQLVPLVARCPQVLALDTQKVVNRAKLLQERLRLSQQQLQALLLRHPQLLLLREERLGSSLDQMQGLLPRKDGQQLRKVVLQQPAVLAMWGRPALGPSHPRMQYLASLLSGTPAAEPQQLLAACLASPAGPALLGLTAEALQARLEALAAVTGQSQAQLLRRFLKSNCNFGKLLTYSPQRVLVNAQVLSSLLYLTDTQAAAMLSKAPALLQYNSDTLAAKALELSPGFAAAQQQLQQGLGQQAAPGRAPAAASDPGSLGPAADQGAGPSPQPEGLPLLAAAAVVRPEVLLLDSQRLLRRLQRLVTLVMGHPHWQQELLGAVETGRVAQWLVMADERLGRLEVLQQAPSTHPAAAAAAAALRPWSLMYVLTMSEVSWRSGRRERQKAESSSKVHSDL